MWPRSQERAGEEGGPRMWGRPAGEQGKDPQSPDDPQGPECMGGAERLPEAQGIGGSLAV